MLKCNKCGSEDIYVGPSEHERQKLDNACMRIEQELPGVIADWSPDSPDGEGPVIDVYNVYDYDKFSRIRHSINMENRATNGHVFIILCHFKYDTEKLYAKEVSEIKARRLQSKL